MRLATATLPALGAGIARPGYDRDAQATGIVHFGIGAFHRAHQAWYTDLAMAAGDRDWMIAGVSLRSGDVAAHLNPQDGLYTLTEQSAAGATIRPIGAVREVVVAPRAAERVIALLAAPATRIASFTITEKGYCRSPDGALDLALAGEGSVYRYLAAGLRCRRDAGLPGLTLLSWFVAECACPSTMVDRIVPATTAADCTAVQQALGLTDAAAVKTEPLSQWVIEDRFAGPGPRWGAVDDPLASDFARLWAGHDTPGVVRALFGPAGSLAPSWRAGPRDLARIEELAAGNATT